MSLCVYVSIWPCMYQCVYVCSCVCVSLQMLLSDLELFSVFLLCGVSCGKNSVFVPPSLYGSLLLMNNLGS